MNSITQFYPGDKATLFAANVLAQITAAGLLAWLTGRWLPKTSAPTRHGIYLAALTWPNACCAGPCCGVAAALAATVPKDAGS